MGLHRNSTANEIDDSTKRLFRTIWWVLHNRDMCLVAFGVDNVRRLRDTDFDTAPLAESDWDEEPEGVPAKFNHIVRPVTQLEKVYLLENCKLAQITGQYMQVLKAPNLKVLPEPVLQNLENSLSAGRRSLPPELRLENIQDWTSSRIWVLVLMAMSYHLECIFYRTLRERSRGRAGTDFIMAPWAQKQRHAMYELDTIIRRVVLAKVAQFCPLSVPTCATTVIAMYIEIALDPFISSNEKLMARVNLHSGLYYLRDTAEYWRGIEWPLQMFEVIVARTSLTLNTQANDAESKVKSLNPFDSDVSHPLTQSDKVDGHGLPAGGNHFDGLKNSEEWLQDFFSSNFIDLYDELAFNAG